MEISHYKHVLRSRLHELQHRLSDIEEKLDSHHNPDWDELAVEREDDEMMESLGVIGKAEIAAIEMALHRIQEGEFGCCGKCGEAIDLKRLDLIPYTPFCARCAQ